MDNSTYHKNLEELQQRMEKLEKFFHDWKSPTINIKLEFEHLHLNELNLEHLIFNLHNLDIHELSGMLNLGNTFSPTIRKKGEENEQQNDNQDIGINLNGKPLSYTIL